MLMSKMFMPTLREAPNDADIASHKLLIRAGLARSSAAGIYNFLPLGIRVINKIEEIVRQEMNNKDAQEILCSALQPKELWEESGRWEAYGKEMFRLSDRNEREFCLGPTHEEIFTNIVKKEVSSYKQLPINLYQIQIKYRDERRPRFGLLRTREFIMKDAYTFDRDEQGLDLSYKQMYDAYAKIFNRCSLDWKAVLADTGAIGGNASHQFMALSDVGESDILYCNACDYAADIEKAEFMLEEAKGVDRTDKELIHTPDLKSIEDLSKFLDMPANKLVKSFVVKIKNKIVLALVRGDREINMVKLSNACDTLVEFLEMATDEDIRAVGSEPGFIGPVGIENTEILVDREVVSMVNFVTGANKCNYHYINVNFKKDFDGTIVDIVSASEGDRCPVCGNPMNMERGIEVGQLFKLGLKYSMPMKCNYLNESGESQPMFMGCYGIGISRTLAAIIEQHHDEDGICWPLAVAPYQVVIVLVSAKDETQYNLAYKLYEGLMKKGIEVILDDRDERPGVKFKDADLIGLPIRITVGKRAPEGIVELKIRTNKDKEEVNFDRIEEKIISILGM